MTIEEMRSLDAEKTYKELEEAKQLVNELKQRMNDDGEYICTLSERCERYRDALLKHKAENQHLADKIHQLYEGAEEQKQRIKRLEEAGDYIVEENDIHIGKEVWRKAKEAKP